MLTCDLYDQTGAKHGKLTLPEELFGQKIDANLMHLALVRQQANRRSANAHTKTRSEVAVSHRKIYRQKGTGNARHASRNANLFRGGGIIFGPRNARNYTKDMPRTQRRIALFSALTVKANEQKILGLSDFSAKKPSTKTILELLKKMSIGRSALIITPEVNQTLKLSARNLPNAKVLTAAYLNVEDLLKYDNLILLEKSVDKMKEVFKPEPTTAKSKE